MPDVFKNWQARARRRGLSLSKHSGVFCLTNAAPGGPLLNPNNQSGALLFETIEEAEKIIRLRRPIENPMTG